MKNLVLEHLQEQKDKLKSDFNKAIQDLIEQENEAFVLAMDVVSPKIQALVNKLNDSNELTSVENDEYFHTFTKANLSEFIDVKDESQKELFTTYMDEQHDITVDFKYDCVSQCVGPSIIINEQGDVLDEDNGKWIIGWADYDSEVKLKELIEAHMEKTGCFPSVIKVDRYGNGKYFNTQK